MLEMPGSRGAGLMMQAGEGAGSGHAQDARLEMAGSGGLKGCRLDDAGLGRVWAQERLRCQVRDGGLRRA